MEAVMKAMSRAGGRMPGGRDGVASGFPEMMNLADELIGRGLPVGMARIVPHGLDAGSGAQLERIARKTTECFAWGSCCGVWGVLFRANLLYELMPVWKRFLERYAGLQVGVAMSGVVGDANELWMATRLALADAHSLGRQLVVLEPFAAAERAQGFGLLRQSSYAQSEAAHPADEWGDLSLLGRGLLPVFAEAETPAIA